MKAYRHLIRHALKTGNTVSVNDGEAWPVKRSNKYRLILEHVESVEEAAIQIYTPVGECLGWALIIPYGLDDDETVADMTETKFMKHWDELYNATL